MLLDADPPDGAAMMTEGLRRACAEALLESGPEHSVEAPLRLFIALANAVTSGLQEGLEDPFIHEPMAIRHLERRCEDMDARAMITALDWSRVRDEARAQARGRSPDSPEVFAATCIALERHVREEQVALRASLVSIGMEEGPASGLARRTVLAGFAVTTTGGEQDWARLLARGNTTAMQDLDTDGREAARKLQAETMRRFMRITDMSDLLDARKEIRSCGNSGSKQTEAQHDPKKMLCNPSIW